MSLEQEIAEAERRGLLLVHLGKAPGGPWRAVLGAAGWTTYQGFGEAAGQALARALMKHTPLPPTSPLRGNGLEDLL